MSVASATTSSSASLTATLTATLTPTPEPTQTLIPTITPTSTPTITPSPTPEPLPLFTSSQLRSDAEPQAYIKDDCIYLAKRWAPGSSNPGTVVVPVMFHGIVKSGHEVTDPKDISEEDFYDFMEYANSLGFKTITTEQLIDFLENNKPIPERSLFLILDDRRPGVIANQFMQVLEKYDWTLTLAYIADPNSMAWAMDEVKEMYKSGRLDVQSHSYTHTIYFTKDTTEEEIRNEIEKSTVALEQNFGKRPLAFIWPGGNFTQLSVQIARQDGYRLGFTAFSRGPLMFNWIPLGEKERQVNDPLMVLPRAWSNSIPVNLDIAVKISQEMAVDAAQRYPEEAEYFRTYCNGELPVK
jgi:peptidoglycan/xylan/chitin deacetylase (PgdA/CDA1 family)